MGRGRSFEGSFRANEWIVAVLRDGCTVPFHYLQPVSAEDSGASVLLAGVGSCPGTAGGGLQNALEGSFGACGPARSRVLQLAVPGGEGDGGLPAHHQSVGSEWLHHADEVSDGDRRVHIGVYQTGNRMFSIDLKDAYFQILVHRESWPYLRFCLKGCGYCSVPCVSVCPRSHRCSPESLLWFRSGRTGGACTYFITWTTGWSLQS